MAQFFETVERYEQVVSLDLETQRCETRAATARAEAERWAAEARTREAKSKARIAAIEITEQFLLQGVKADDLPRWTKVLAKCGVTVEHLESALQQLGSLESVVKAREKSAEELGAQIPRLESRVKALTGQQDNAAAAVQAVREKALREVRQAGQQVAREVK